MSSTLHIEPIGSEEQLRTQLPHHDVELCDRHGSARRRREAMAWRKVAYQLLGSEARLGYDEHGAPVVENMPLHIGVSHSRTHVAVIISPQPCAVDIESHDRDFSHAFARYLTATEQQLSTSEHYPAVAWCAKEALYKWHRHSVSNIRDHITLHKVDIAGGKVRGSICGSEVMDINVECSEEYVVAYIG